MAADAEMLQQLKQLQEQVSALCGESAPQINEVKVKLPNFWTEKPKLWFAQAEAQFEISGIKTDNTKYGYVLSMLDTKTATLVEGIISNPPATNRYENLKGELIKKLSISREQQVRQLLSGEELGDRKASIFLQHLRSLAGTAMTDESILRELWMRRLPKEVQRILLAQKDLELDKVAEIADAIMEATPSPPPNVFAASTASSSPSELTSLMKCIETLTRKVEALSTGNPRNPRSTSRSQPKSRAASKSKTRLCWYHKRYNVRASKCTSPCSWVPKQEGNHPSNQ
ncbi:uncharacterized protein [Choristoneura fumiferana]|uniref:uncharacterized protein n=1 Tax=Choristoneura fumiferana TaxID=7141 RepID=UPI003D15E1E7